MNILAVRMWKLRLREAKRFGPSHAVGPQKIRTEPRVLSRRELSLRRAGSGGNGTVVPPPLLTHPG